MVKAEKYLRGLTLLRWAEKLRRDGPPPAPSHELRAIFAARHAERIAECEARGRALLGGEAA